MKKFGEDIPAEQEMAAESGADTNVESLESTEARVNETSEGAIDDGENLLGEAMAGIKAEEVDDGPSLLETAQTKMSEVGDKIRDLAATTAEKLKVAVLGKDLKDMDDEELSDHLNKKREEHGESIGHYRALLHGKKKDIGGFRTGHAFGEKNKRKKERREAFREAEKRNLEVLTPQEQKESEDSKLLSKIETMNREYTTLVRKYIDAEKVPEVHELRAKLKELYAQAEERGLEVLGWTEQAREDDSYAKERKKADKADFEATQIRRQRQHEDALETDRQIAKRQQEIDEYAKAGVANERKMTEMTGLAQHERDRYHSLLKQEKDPSLDSSDRGRVTEELDRFERTSKIGSREK
ncbi:hypothetical protein HOB10_04470 [Candidatus Parcubacteria bacterium]|jgi:hypothetical protein|nr:hypothetical protein [Candidatus Parcubacteria bacterium]